MSTSGEEDWVSCLAGKRFEKISYNESLYMQENMLFISCGPKRIGRKTRSETITE